jgi:hypothetical protein
MIIIEHKLTLEHLQEFIKGKRLCFRQSEIEIIIYPPNYGIFMSHEQYAEIMRLTMHSGLIKPNTIFDLIEKIELNQ